MQTTKERFIESLTSRGMWPKEAEAVLELAKPKFEHDGYRVTWDRPADEYPAPFYVVGQMILDQEALAYIDEHCPMAFYRPMFTPDPEAEIARLKAAA